MNKYRIMSAHLHQRLQTDDSPPTKQTNMACDEHRSTTTSNTSTTSAAAPSSTSLSFKSNHNSRRYRQHHLYWPLSGIIFMVSLSSFASSEMIYRVDPLGKYLQCYTFCLHSGLICNIFQHQNVFFPSLLVLFILIILMWGNVYDRLK